MTKIVHIVGARPNFVKMAPVIDALADDSGIDQVVAHTGQHYDRSLNDDVLEQLGFPAPDVFMGVGSGTHAEQTGRVLIESERVLVEHAPDVVVVAGDVNSTVAVALAASKLGIPIAHVESGLRSFDWTMPEEINRVLTDRLSDLLFIHSPEARENLIAEGIDEGRIHHVGNTMIDSLRRFEQRARDTAAWQRFDVDVGEYVLVTLHRPSNVDRASQLEGIVEAVCALSERNPVIFPLHPRTRARLDETGGLAQLDGAAVHCTEPLGYVDFLSLEVGAGAIVTDSGGVQEEASALGVACYTLRPNTERPITVKLGTNVLLGDDPASISSVRVLRQARTREIPLWDGRAGERAASVIAAAARAGTLVKAA